MRITPAKIEDLEALQPRGEEQTLINELGIEHFYNLLQLGQTFSIWQEDELIGVMGIYRLWRGVYEVWILPSQLITKCPKQYLRTVKQYMNSILLTYPIRRLQTTAVNNTLHDRWMTFLGFEKEGILKGYSPDGTDYANWSLINVKSTEGINQLPAV